MRQDLSRFVEDAVSTHERVDITRNGRRAAVLLSTEDYDSPPETLDVLAAPALVADVREALTQVEARKIVSHEQVVADQTARRSPAP